MARKVRAASIETRTARLKLPPRLKPYAFTVIARGIAVGYRRNKNVGSWVLRAANGRGGYWTDAIGFADDHEEADGETVLSWWQAQDRARTLVRGKGATDERPVTVAEALDAYRLDLIARNGAVVNAHNAGRLLPPALLAKPVTLLEAKELRRWRDTLLPRFKPSSVNRTIKVLKAALNLAAAHDPRIGNANAWRTGLAGLPDAHVARHIALPDHDVRALVSAAYEVDHAFGLWVETVAITGARPSQVCRLDVADLLDGNGSPRLLMPSSLKGKGRKRIERRPVPITTTLAAKLQTAAHGRAPLDPLLAKGDGGRWGPHTTKVFARAAARAGLAGVTAYALRHSSIIRALLGGVPTRVVAAVHDTSIPMIERSYSVHIADHSDAVSRAVLLDLGRPSILD